MIELLKLIGTGGSGAAIPIVLMYSQFTQEDVFIRHVADSKTGLIFELVETARAERDDDYHDALCRTLQEEIAMLCADSPTHSICLDRQMHLDRAGCQ